MRLSFILFFISLFYLVQGQEFTFERINSNNGLSQNNVVDIFQDSQGYLWIATHEGVNRYDGIDFKVFRVSEDEALSVSSNLITKFTEDKEGNIWIATLDRGDCMYNPKNESFIRFVEEGNTDLEVKYNAVRNVFCDSKNRIFILTLAGIYYLQKDHLGEYKKVLIPDLKNEPNRVVRYVNCFEDKDGDVNVVMWDKIMKIFIPDDTLKRPTMEQVFKGLPFKNMRIVYPFENSYLIGHGAGFSQVSLDSEKPDSYKIATQYIGSVLEFVQTEPNEIWAGSDRGLFRLVYSGNPEQGFVQTHHFAAGDNEYSISNNNVICVTRDNTGGLWVGSYGGGICKLSTLNRQFRTYKSTLAKGSLSANKILSIYEDPQRNLWIGTEGGGVNYLPFGSNDYSEGFEKYYCNIPGEQHIVYDFMSVKFNAPEIWMGTAYNSLIARFKQNGIKQDLDLGFLPIKGGMVFCILQDANDNIWLGTYLDGIYKARFKNGDFKLEHYTMENSNICSNIIRSFLEDSKGRLWVGTNNGLMVLDGNKKNDLNPKFKIFKQSAANPDSLSNNYVLPIIESKDGSIWMGTLGGGLIKYIEGDKLCNGSFKRWTEKDGLSNNNIKEIIEDDNGDFWIGSNKGLTKFNPYSEKMRNFNHKDGLQSFEFTELAGCKRHDGEILMGGVNGFNAFYPDDITQDTTPPNLLLTNIEVMNKAVAVNEEINGKVLLTKALNEMDEIILQYAENDFTIHFTALHMANPEFNRYKYMLEGYDKDWINTTSTARFAKYTNLDEGTYVFRVKASNSDGFWNLNPKTIKIIIQPPFYKTRLFKLLLILFMVILIVGFFLLRLRSIRIKKELLEITVQERTVDLMEVNARLEESREEIFAQNDQLKKQTLELEEHKENLEGLVDERTKDLQLAMEQAKESDQLKSAFLANMSHEIRTPLNAVVGFSGLLTEQELLHEEQLYFKNLIQVNSDRLLYLLDDILVLSLIESNQLKIENSPFNVHVLLDECLSTVKINANNENVDFIQKNHLQHRNVLINSDKNRVN